MQFTTALIALVAVAGINAIPTYPPPSGGDDTTVTNNCGQDQESLCCSSGLGVLDCGLTGLLGTSCSQQEICCQNTGSGDQYCTNSDGTTISIPITIGGLTLKH